MNNFEKVKNNLKSDAKELYEETQEQTSSIYSDLKNKTEAASKQVKETVADMYEEGKKKVGQAEDLLGEYSDSLIKAIKEKPLTSVLVATGIGYILSKMFKK
jgi:ElaB/YqjD/DUF883 family membrane-anchored ribosome-binding protein